MPGAATTTYSVRYRADGETYRRDVRVAGVADIAARLKSILAHAHQVEQVELLEVRPPIGTSPEQAQPEPEKPRPREDEQRQLPHAISLAEIGIDRDRAEHLAAAGVVTLADLKAWVREHGSDLTQIRGIGQAGQRHIREQVEAYLAAPPRN